MFRVAEMISVVAELISRVAEVVSGMAKIISRIRTGLSYGGKVPGGVNL
jgi:hypothetical protein